MHLRMDCIRDILERDLKQVERKRMAVLVEAITLIVRRSFLDVCYPSGSDGFISAHEPDGERLRFTIADECIVAISTCDRELASRLGEHLVDHGAIEVDDDTNEFVDFAFVDQLEGPAMLCPWLEWNRDERGVASVRYIPIGSTPVVTPPQWTPESSTSLHRTDMRLESERMFKLAEENGIEYWLDFETGKQIAGLSSPIRNDE